MRRLLCLAGIIVIVMTAIPVAAQPAALASASDMAIAYDHFQKKEYSEAAVYYSKALKQSPNDGDMLLGLAWSQFYMGEYWAAKELFGKVLALYPGNASALEGLKSSPKRNYSVIGGYNYAWLKYSHISFKSGGYSYNIPVTLAYKDLWALTMAHTYTVIKFNPTSNNAYQKEYAPSGSVNIGKHLTLRAAYDYITVNDIATDAGKVTTGGFTVQNYDPNTTFFISAGGYESYSAYRPFRVVQTTPHIGLGYDKYFVDLFMMYTNVDKNNENLRSFGANAAVGPFHGLTATLAGYTGDKRLPVDNWGTTIYNNQDLYRRGWKAGLSYAYKGLTVFAMYGIDNAEATTAGPVYFAYTSRTTVAGLTYRL